MSTRIPTLFEVAIHRALMELLEMEGEWTKERADAIAVLSALRSSPRYSAEVKL